MPQSTTDSSRRRKLLDLSGPALTTIAVVMFIFGAVVVLAGLVQQGKEMLFQLGVMALNISLTVLLINALEQRRFRVLEKRELTKQMASAANRFATEAVNRLRLRGWLEDGSLEGEVFAGANLAKVRLEKARLRKADLANAILTQVEFAGADLSEAKLFGADLSGSYIHEAELDRAQLSDANRSEIVMPESIEHARLCDVLACRIDVRRRKLTASKLSGDWTLANFQDSDLTGVDLSSAVLAKADFRNATLTNVKFDEANLNHTRLPTGREQLTGVSFRQADLSRRGSVQSRSYGDKDVCLVEARRNEVPRYACWARLLRRDIRWGRPDRQGFEGRQIQKGRVERREPPRS